MSNLSLLSSIAAQLAPDNAVLHTGSKRTRQIKDWFEEIVATAIQGEAREEAETEGTPTTGSPDLAFTK